MSLAKPEAAHSWFHPHYLSLSTASAALALYIIIAGWPELLLSVPCLSYFLSLSIPLFFCLFPRLSVWSHHYSVFKHFRLFRADGHEVPVGV